MVNSTVESTAPRPTPLADDLRREIEQIEDRIDTLRTLIQNCRKAITVSRFAVGAGAVGFVATLGGALRPDATLLVFAIAAMVGGIVWLGANKSSLRHAIGEMHAKELVRADLIDLLPWQTIEPLDARERHHDPETGALDQ
jgi:hypothetical protein